MRLKGPVRPGEANLVLLRHGASTANTSGNFGGWDDAPLAQLGLEQAQAAGALMKSRGLTFDAAFSSVLRRATTTAWHVLDALDRHWIPLTCDWRLNERHYGALQGMSKTAAVERFGADQVRAWRRGFHDRPPGLKSPKNDLDTADPRYRSLLPGQLPVTESLADTVSRVSFCLDEAIAPRLEMGARILVVAHGNSIRALLVTLRCVDQTHIRAVEVAHASPILLHWRRGEATVLDALFDR